MTLYELHCYTPFRGFTYPHFLIAAVANISINTICVNSASYVYILLQEVQKMKNIDELEAFILKHGENIVDMMGAEIDRIEMKLRVSNFLGKVSQ